MSRWTLYFDVAGTIDPRTATSDCVTLSCISVPADDEANIRAEISHTLPKWRNTSIDVANKLVKLILGKSIYVSVVQYRKTEPAWSNFWNYGESHQEQLLQLAEVLYSGSHRNRDLRFMRPGNLLKYYFFAVVSADLLGACIRDKKLSPVVDSAGYQVLNLNLLFDSDITGDQNQEVFKDLWQNWSNQSRIRDVLRISPQINRVEIMTEQDDSNLLLPDYAAGIFHSLNSAYVQAPSGVPERELQNLANLLIESHKFSFEATDFNLTFPNLVQQMYEILAAKSKTA